MNWVQFKDSCLSHVLWWHCGSMLASYTRGGWVVGVRILMLNDIFLSLNSLNSVKTFRKNSNSLQ